MDIIFTEESSLTIPKSKNKKRGQQAFKNMQDQLIKLEIDSNISKEKDDEGSESE